jgi:hypothetical protein
MTGNSCSQSNRFNAMLQEPRTGDMASQTQKPPFGRRWRVAARLFKMHSAKTDSAYKKNKIDVKCLPI